MYVVMDPAALDQPGMNYAHHISDATSPADAVKKRIELAGQGEYERLAEIEWVVVCPPDHRVASSVRRIDVSSVRRIKTSVEHVPATTVISARDVTKL